VKRRLFEERLAAGEGMSFISPFTPSHHPDHDFCSALSPLPPLFVLIRSTRASIPMAELNAC